MDLSFFSFAHSYFSYRWTQLFDQCLDQPEELVAPGFDAPKTAPDAAAVLSARPRPELTPAGFERAPYAPVPLKEAQAAILRERPALVCAPHVEARE